MAIYSGAVVDIEARAEALLRKKFTSISAVAWSDLQAQEQPGQDPPDKA